MNSMSTLPNELLREIAKSLLEFTVTRNCNETEGYQPILDDVSSFGIESDSIFRNVRKHLDSIDSDYHCTLAYWRNGWAGSWVNQAAFGGLLLSLVPNLCRLGVTVLRNAAGDIAVDAFEPLYGIEELQDQPVDWTPFIPARNQLEEFCCRIWAGKGTLEHPVLVSFSVRGLKSSLQHWRLYASNWIPHPTEGSPNFWIRDSYTPSILSSASTTFRASAKLEVLQQVLIHRRYGKKASVKPNIAQALPPHIEHITILGPDPKLLGWLDELETAVSQGYYPQLRRVELECHWKSGYTASWFRAMAHKVIAKLCARGLHVAAIDGETRPDYSVRASVWVEEGMGHNAV
ncbi:hypothetical protein BU26DRAFT_565030 [Trematosphaeria pertusa]|uniref:Uncharacterized protein n=1 Tax=Trematosphaeria pertusa TaxID=390896 RepID=A0A6A6IH64_9PLEO|nr:uncharacterized protein BU26DRAFT_565030 [Trematosphaeria pertusa]KAF2249378.1 hypothetical protein BU26DRAFT_565030 [Trematosphaeria pertusa]